MSFSVYNNICTANADTHLQAGSDNFLPFSYFVEGDINNLLNFLQSLNIASFIDNAILLRINDGRNQSFVTAGDLRLLFHKRWLNDQVRMRWLNYFHQQHCHLLLHNR